VTGSLESSSERVQWAAFLTRLAAFALAVAWLGLAGVTPAQAQISEPPTDAPVQIGPLVLSPVVRLLDVGHDSNVFNRSADDNPQGDYTARLSPSVQGWLRLPHVKVNGRSQFDLYYFKALTDLRAVDSDSAARVELVLNRLTPYFEGNITNTRHRQNLEIDAIARRRNNGGKAGLDLRLTDKMAAGVFVHRSSLQYEPNSLYLGTDLGHELNHTSEGEGVAVRWALTPYTTLMVEGERQRDRFDFAGDRNSDIVRIAPTVEFNPLALVSGRASIGFQRRRFLGGGLPDFNGTVALADLSYTLLGRTRFTLAAHRSLEYSYLVGQHDYLVSELTGSVTQRLGDSWDLGGLLGRGRLTYRAARVPIGPTVPAIPLIPNETVLTYGADIGYTLGRARIGFNVEHRARDTDEATLFRGFERLRIGSNLTYTF
jgi:hypothetical protein